VRLAAEELPPSPEGEDARSTAATSRRHVPIHAGSAWRDPGWSRPPPAASSTVHGVATMARSTPSGLMTALRLALAARCVATPDRRDLRRLRRPSDSRTSRTSPSESRPMGTHTPACAPSASVPSTSQASYRLDAPTRSPGRPGEPTGSSPLDVPSASAPSQEGPMHSALPDTHDLVRCRQRSWPRPEPHGSGLVDMG
jgi:hypothetical protein